MRAVEEIDRLIKPKKFRFSYEAKSNNKNQTAIL